MKTLPVKYLLRFMSLLFISAGICWGYIWFEKVLPHYKYEHVFMDPTLSSKEIWDRLQSHIIKHGWSHHDYYPVGRYGNKEWAINILNEMERKNEIAPKQLEGWTKSLNFMTNKNLRIKGGNDKNLRDEWINWWDKNKEKSQLDWIKDGFKKNGILIQNSLNDSNINSLLSILGDTETDEYTKYNAFRYLRDSDFNSTKYAIDLRNSRIPKAIEMGLLEYSKEEKTYPRKSENIGRLNIEKYSILPASQYPELAGLPSKFFIITYSSIIFLFFMSAICFWGSLLVTKGKK